MSTVALIGCGRFGLAVGTLAEDHGHTVKAYDPNEAPPNRWKTSSFEDCVASADFILLAIPLSGFENLQPAPGIFIDVASVKMKSKAVLASQEITYVSTHPLFGPRSVDENRENLKWVLCPNEKDPESTVKVREFLKSLNVEIVEMSEKEHDKMMAYTQATAFFLGRGLDGILPAVPKGARTPSADALFRLVQSASGEKDHVGNTILRDNVFAHEARVELLEKLFQIHSDKPVDESMASIREEIDQLDRSILKRFARREELQKQISLMKKGLGKPVQDPEREKSALEERQDWAKELNLDNQFVANLFNLVLHWSRASQEKVR